MALTTSHAPPPKPNQPLDKSLREYLQTHSDSVIHITKPVHTDDIGALSAQVDDPILFENIVDHPGFRLTDILVKNRRNQARALGVEPENYLRTLAYRLRQPPRGFKHVDTGPVKEVILTGDEVDLTKLPATIHKEGDEFPFITAMNILKDPETGFYNTSHCGTIVDGPRRGFPSFATQHSNVIIRKYKEMGLDKMPMAYVFGIPPAYEIMANFSGLHMDMWGELEMVGTIMDQDIEMVPCETIDLNVPAHAEIIIEGHVNLTEQFKTGEVTSPSMYYMPHYEHCPEFIASAITMREDRPIYRNHQTCPETDHQSLPRLCHEAVLYNRLTEMGLKVKEIRFPVWGGALSCLIQFDYRFDGSVNDALMAVMGAPWLNTKMVVALSPDTDIENARDVYLAIASRADPERDIIIVPHTRASPYDPASKPLKDFPPFRTVGKIGIDATIKSRYDTHDFDRAWPKNWGKVHLKDYL